MKIKQITFTGADDTVSIADFVKFAKDMPDQVEWGMFVGKSSTECNRFPSYRWLMGVISSLNSNKKTYQCTFVVNGLENHVKVILESIVMKH